MEEIQRWFSPEVFKEFQEKIDYLIQRINGFVFGKFFIEEKGLFKLPPDFELPPRLAKGNNFIIRGFIMKRMAEIVEACAPAVEVQNDNCRVDASLFRKEIEKFLCSKIKEWESIPEWEIQAKRDEALKAVFLEVVWFLEEDDGLGIFLGLVLSKKKWPKLDNRNFFISLMWLMEYQPYR